MARNSYDMDDNMKNSGSETYDKTKNRAETARTVRRITVRTVRRTVLRTLRTMGETAKDKKDAAV